MAVISGSVLVVSARRSAELARAQWAADAAALAAASVGYDRAGVAAAASVAEANGAVVTKVSVTHRAAGLGAAGLATDPATTSWPIVVVEVERAGITAKAAATRIPALRP